MNDNGLQKRYTLTLVNVALIVLGLGAIMFIMVYQPGSNVLGNQAMIALFASVVGALVNQHSNSQQWWFGTTKGTADTTAVIRDIATGTPPPHSTMTTTTSQSTTGDADDPKA
jgi:xanthine/uracil permease